MATTTNFNWETPDDTDLVKDGAAAIRTALNGVDTSFVDLKGGTTGQVLSKASNTDLDFTWATDASGIPATIFDAKGDIIAATAADTAARLAVGTNGQVLTADSTTATGLKWATASSTPTFVGCHLYKSGTQSINNATDTAITWDSEQFDTDSFHSTSTNTSRITIPTGKAGKYLFTVRILWATNSTGSRELKFFKNGTEQFWSSSATAATQTTTQYSTIWSAAEADYYEVYFWQNSGGALSSIAGVSAEFSCQYLGA